MLYYSTNNSELRISFEEATLKGMEVDGGLYMPTSIPQLDFSNFSSSANINSVAIELAKCFIDDNELCSSLGNLYDFNAPLIQLDDNLFVLELFHGPTLAFKDFGALFLAKIYSTILRTNFRRANILVATSGDTGSAVANAFFKSPFVNVVLLYPKGKVSHLQEKQLTTFGENIFAIEVDGNFDDCQRLVKQAFADESLKSELFLTSANSINIARLLPQISYYINSFLQLSIFDREVYFTVPSGNLGNLTAGLFAKFMGLPISKFIAAVNQNNSFETYLSTGQIINSEVIPTLSNAMDVGNPSNLARINNLYNFDLLKMKEDITPLSFSDDETLSMINTMYKKYNYTCCPHTAVGFLAHQKMIKHKTNKFVNVVLSPAHPAKFKETVEKGIDKKITLPEQLQLALTEEKKVINCDNKFNTFKKIIYKLF
ncbi:MAG TPA: threonine synthase [Ignavibacteriaceae bacterium]|nr:threonine synthase [Ignavibacteriaceae bacterium]